MVDNHQPFHVAYKTLYNNSQINNIYTEFSNAFDRVSHVAFISKLKLCGVQFSLLSWINYFNSFILFYYFNPISNFFLV